MTESISTTYGAPLLRQAKAGRNALLPVMPSQTTVLARWEDTESVLTLIRDSSSPQYQLVLISKTLSARAGAAIKESLRLDTQEAPQREREQRTKDAAAARVAWFSTG